MIQNNPAISLADAKKTKKIMVKSLLITFEDTGYTYMTWNFGLNNQTITDLNLKNKLLDYTSTNISALASTKTYTLPAGNGLYFVPGQKYNVSGCVQAGNNGIKTVAIVGLDVVTVVETLIDETAGSSITFSAIDRYKYFDDTNIQRDFIDKSGIEGLYSAIITEKDRIMIKYNNYINQIEACLNVAEVDAITINFSA